MIRSPNIVQVLKKHLKASSITYRELAGRLGVSESAVKQMFAGGSFSLRRMDQICEALGLDLGELVDMALQDEARIEELDVTLERELVADTRLLLVAHCLVNHWTMDDILQHYSIDEAAMVRLLAKLDRMKLIELLPDNRVRLLVAGNFRWRQNGPIEQHFRAQLQAEFLDHGFHGEGALHLVKSGYLTPDGQKQVLERMAGVGRLFDEMNHEARKQPLGVRRGTTMVLAIRNWHFTAFASLERQGSG